MDKSKMSLFMGWLTLKKEVHETFWTKKCSFPIFNLRKASFRAVLGSFWLVLAFAHFPPNLSVPTMPSTDTREVILEARELTREFDGVKALDRFSFKLHRGEILGLLGANGAGKTTAMNCLLGLTLPTSGDLFAFGKPLAPNRIEILRKANFCSAYVSLPGNLKVWQNLLVFAQIYGVSQPKKKIAELLEMLEITDLRNRVTGQLSAGESTRVNLCKAFLNDPELLMLDEPTASLDPDIADKVRKIVLRVQSERNIGILYTSHNMRDIEEVCDRVIFLHKGKIVAEGTPTQIVQKFSENSLEDVFIKIARSGDLEA
jgi:ABC-2 type transport system ATP-binding protein